MNAVEFHRDAVKERQSLPPQVGARFAEIEEALRLADGYVRGLAHKRERGWNHRTMLVADASHLGTTYRMAWEIVSRDTVVVWAYGPHEGFYRRLARRARQ